MDFDLSREQEMIRKEVRKFAQNEIDPVANELDEKEEFSAELTRKMGEIGLFGMFVSEKYNGQGLDYISYIIAVEEVARIDGSQAATSCRRQFPWNRSHLLFRHRRAEAEISTQALHRRRIMGLWSDRADSRL